jgi:hypothetical protein
MISLLDATPSPSGDGDGKKSLHFIFHPSLQPSAVPCPNKGMSEMQLFFESKEFGQLFKK